MTSIAGSPLNGRQLALVLLGILVATVVVPPAGAWWLNAYRVRQTQTRALRAAEAVSVGGARLAALGLDVDVACGPGQLPKSHEATGQDAWVSHAVMAPALFGAKMTPDSWGQCFLMNVGARRRGESVWILSAGPNGRVDTPFGAEMLAGDDIGAVVK